jgi:hypothetical protein
MPGNGAENAFIRIAAARGLNVPDTPAQKEWATAFTAT